jgi:hypothetical protein
MNLTNFTNLEIEELSAGETYLLFAKIPMRVVAIIAMALIMAATTVG